MTRGGFSLSCETSHAMKADPLRAMEYRPAAFITAAGRSYLTIATYEGPPETYGGTMGIASGILRHSEYALYSLVPLYLLPDTTDPTIWTLYRYGKTWTRAVVGKVPIYGLVGYGLDPWQLEPFFAALASLGIRYRSQSRLTADLWLRTLRGSVSVAEFPSPWGYVGRPALRPGRREAVPGTYRGAVLMDIPQAFPTAMASRPLPTRLIQSDLWWQESGIALAKVKGGRGDWTMLPRGVDSDTVYWTFDELRTALAYGADVKLLQVWKGECEQDLFSAWYDLAGELRGLPGQSGRLAKALTNRLWGSFTHDSRVKYSRTTFASDGTPFIEYLKRGHSPEMTYLSALIQGRVNVRLYEEGLRLGAVFCETDSAIVPLQVGSGLSSWRRQTEIADLEILSDRALRYKCMLGVRAHYGTDGCSFCAGERWHTKTQGCLDDSVESELQYRKERQHVAPVF